MKKISNWWYLLPVIFNIIGGIIAWAANKKHDPKKAKSFLLVGIILFVLCIVVIIGSSSYFTTTSLDQPREEARIASPITTTMHQIRSMVIIGVSAYFTTISLNRARGEARIASAITTMHQIRSLAYSVHDTEGSYENLDCSHDRMVDPCEGMEFYIGEVPVFNTSKEEYCAYIETGRNSYYCIDSSLSGLETDVFPGEAGYCSEDTYNCPPESIAN